MKIGNVNLANPYILAPMAGVTDLPFRLLCKEQGAGLLCMEMISAKALQYKNKNTKALLAIHPEEYPVSLQLFGSDPKIMSEMAKMIEELPFQILDINMGCPVPKVVRNGEGSALMKNPKLVHEIVSAVSKAIEKPVTVKIRKGFDDDHVHLAALALANELVEFIPLFHTGAGNALIGVNARQLPAGFPVDAIRVITHLCFVAVELFFLLGGHPAVGRHTLEKILCAVYIQRLDGCWDGSYPFRRCVHALHPIAPF